MVNKIPSNSTVNDSDSFDTLKKELISIRRSEHKAKIAIFKKARAKKLRLKRNRKRKIDKYRNEQEALLHDRGKRLETFLPKSEAWFRELYLKEDMGKDIKYDLYKDQFNMPFNSTYIPDVHNRGYKYIIEIDGSIHNRADVIIRDQKKDYYFRKRGYLVIRIIHNDMDSYRAGIETLKAHIARINAKSSKPE